MIMKHLMPVTRRSAALFMLLVSDVTHEKKTLTGTYIYFLYKCDKIMVENKTSLQGQVLFSQSLFISRFSVCLFSILFL